MRIDVIQEGLDTRGEAKKRDFARFSFGKKVTSVLVIDSYTIDKKLSDLQISKIKTFLAKPPLEKIFDFKKSSFSFAIEIGYLPGVTDNIGATTRESIEDLLKIKFKDEEHVYSSRVYLVRGSLTKKEVEIFSEGQYNRLIQQVRIFSKNELGGNFPSYLPKVSLLKQKEKVIQVPLSVTDEELVAIGKEGILGPDGVRRGPLALDLPSMHAIQSYFKKQKRNPTDIELEALAQTWSEHCKHTIFANPIDELQNGLYKTYIKQATYDIRKKKGTKDFCVSVFTDNSGAIVFDENYLITHKVETHNSPSALDPFGGAITGIVGVNRDAMGFGLGAKPVANVFGYCFGKPKDEIELYKDKSLTQKMLSPKRILEGVVHGVNVGGNCSGIPTVHGFSYFDNRFKGKPLVFVGTIGLIPKKIGKKDSWKKGAVPGDYIVMAGGRVGADGIHGATFSSVALDSGSPRTAVQIGDPITQKKMSDVIIKEIREQGLYTSITDNGAGGLSSSVSEMARESGGCRVDISLVPTKYPGLLPWQIWISESQERMTLSVPKSKWKKFQALMKSRGVEATIIGEFTKSGKCEVYDGKNKILSIDMDFLHGGLPKIQQKTERLVLSNERENAPIVVTNYTQALLSLLGTETLGSHEFIYSQYDHEVQAGSVLKPLVGRGRVNGDASVFKPVLSSKKAVATTSALYPEFTERDPYQMAGAAIDTAVRNLVSVGVSPEKIAILDNFCWCSSSDPKRLSELKEAVRGCYDFAVSYGTPFISGKDSMWNDFRGYDKDGNPVSISIPPTLLISGMGVVDDVSHVVSPDFKIAGDLIYIVGETKDELGGGEWYRSLGKSDFGKVAKTDSKKFLLSYKKIHTAISKKIIASAISVSHGGLGIALLRASLSGGLGFSAKIPKSKLSAESFIFSESQGRILLSISPKNKKEFEKIMKGIPISFLGKVSGNQNVTVFDSKGRRVVNTTLKDVKNTYQEPFKGY